VDGIDGKSLLGPKRLTQFLLCQREVTPEVINQR
jgi:hypothetical protein